VQVTQRDIVDAREDAGPDLADAAYRDVTLTLAGSTTRDPGVSHHHRPGEPASGPVSAHAGHGAGKHPAMTAGDRLLREMGVSGQQHASGLGLQVGQRVHADIAGPIGQHDRSRHPRRVRTQMDPRGIDERRTETEPGGRIVIPAGDHHPRAGVTQAHQCVFTQLHRIERGDSAVVHVTADQHRINPLGAHDPHQLVEKLGLGRTQVSTVQRTAEMPVRRVKEAHEKDRRTGLRQNTGGPPTQTRQPRQDSTDVRAVVQRVSSANVSVRGSVVGEIGPGLVVLVGVGVGDDNPQARALARKVFTLRILREEQSAQDARAPLLVISQFTLYADTSKGRRPSWNAAAAGPVAEPLVDAVIAELRALGATVATGMFGADMQVSLVNDGPVTIILDT
jgi:D-tyrosyl-tRNA(Tyr) deacylase